MELCITKRRKKMIRNSAFLAVWLLLLPAVVMADRGDTICYVVNSLKYRVLEWDGSVSVSDVDYAGKLPVSSDGTLILPSEVTLDGRTFPVSAIEKDAFSGHPELKHLIIGEGIQSVEDKAFQQCVNLESIHIPSSLEMLDDWSFLGCSRLKEIVVADGNPTYDSRGNCNAVISTCDNVLVKGCQATTIPASVTVIGRAAFYGLQSIHHINIPEGIERICACAFKECVNLSSMSLPKSLRTLDASAFWGCVSLAELDIPENVSKIGESVVAFCHNLEKMTVSSANKVYDSRNGCNAIVEKNKDRIVAACRSSKIQNGIKSIAPGAFVGVPVTEISIPGSVTEIGERAFWGCADCASIKVDADNAVFDSRGDCNAIMETATGKLVLGCARTVITERVREIGNSAFARIPMPCYMVIPEGVESIAENAFYLCPNMEMLVLPKSLRTIKWNAFSGCTGLQMVVASSPGLFIGDYAFAYNPNLYVADLPQNVTFESNRVFLGSPFQKVYERLYRIVE